MKVKKKLMSSVITELRPSDTTLPTKWQSGSKYKKY